MDVDGEASAAHVVLAPSDRYDEVLLGGKAGLVEAGERVLVRGMRNMGGGGGGARGVVRDLDGFLAETRDEISHLC